MDQAQLMEEIHKCAYEVLVWIGFGTLVGLLAKAIMPGRDPGGAIATLVMGIGGSVLGSGVLQYFWVGHHVRPISLEGFGVSIAGAFILLAFYRFMRHDKYLEGEQPVRAPYIRRGRGRTREIIVEE
jgi:uncharacterized membrane protein YeaQ/YmgE (transglycosylase-associated protein family)